ncbi:hypothetical protein [Seramator thermalis]|uniref:hypothetical protein n=1 Tax=Seramator thermalis TaxID=2496270 RepID=UPI00101D425C|nr:hypothetical protein [Seramator thermalis]
MLNLNEWDSVPKSAISSISSISSAEDIEDIEDFDSEQMPTFSESVSSFLPSLLSQIAAKAVSPKMPTCFYWAASQPFRPVCQMFTTFMAVAQIAPYFSNGSIPDTIGKDNLWFL